MNRIGPGTLLFCFFAVLLGLAGIYWWKKSHQPVIAPARSAPKQPTYLVASTDLPAGRTIHPSDFMTITISPEALRAKRWPALLMADGRQLLNRRLKAALKQGDPFPPEAFYPEGIEADIAEQIEPGMRAVSISVSHDALPIKATPGVLVDVLFRTNEDEDHNVPELTTLLVENVRVLAIDQNSTTGTSTKNDKKVDKHLITLAVSQTQALRMKTAEGHGEFSLSLRSTNGEDYSAVLPEQLTLAEVFHLPDPKPEPVPFVAEVFRRGQRREVRFDDDAQQPKSSKNSQRRSISSPPRSTKVIEPIDQDRGAIEEVQDTDGKSREIDDSIDRISPAPINSKSGTSHTGKVLTDSELNGVQPSLLDDDPMGAIIVSTDMEFTP